jgi:hypothetical protein
MPKRKTEKPKPAVRGIPDSKKQQTIENADNAPSFYANFVQLMTTKNDFRLLFCQVEETTDNLIRVRAVAKLFLTPGLGKATEKLLAGALKAYEEKYGQAGLSPPDDLPGERGRRS